MVALPFSAVSPRSGFGPACSCGECFGFEMGLVDAGYSRSELECRATLAEIAVIAGYGHVLCVQGASEIQDGFAGTSPKRGDRSHQGASTVSLRYVGSRR